jgi:hypothetical protein
MIPYKKTGVDFFPRSLWWITNNFYLLFILLFFLLGLSIVLIMSGVVSGLPFLFWAVIGMCVYLYVNRNARPCCIELRDKLIIITCSKYFSVYDATINDEDLRVELYKNKYYRGSYWGTDSQHYLYFTSATDKNVWIELSADFYALGKILEVLSQKQSIALGDRELTYVSDYRKQLETDKTPGARLARIMIPVILILLAIFIVYQCSGK